MQVAHAHATFVTPEAIDESLTTIVARSVLEAALKDEEPAELWFELGSEDSDEVSRLSIDLSYTDIEDLLRLSPEDEIALSLDGEAIECVFGDPDVEAHGLKGAIAIAVTSAAILAPAGHAAAMPQVSASATQHATVQATAQVGAAATVQVSNLAAKAQVSTLRAQVSKSQAQAQASKLRGFKLLRAGLVR
jgi:hypothetical protein